MKKLLIILILFSGLTFAQYSNYKGTNADSFRISKLGYGIRWNNTQHKYFTKKGTDTTWFGDTSGAFDTTKNYNITGKWNFKNDSIAFNNVWYVWPAARVANSGFRDSAGVLSWRPYKVFNHLKNPLRLQNDSLVFDWQNINFKMTGSRFDLIQNIRTTDAPTWAGFTAINGNIPQVGNYSIHNNFTSGWVGAGYRLDYGVSTANKSNLEVDDLTVRGTMSVYELLIRQIRATNGAVFVSASAKVDSVWSGYVRFADETNSDLCPFADNDLVISQRFKPDGTTIVRNVKATITSVSGRICAVTYNTGTFQKGDEVVRIGNTTNAARQNSIYLTSDDTNSPFMDMISGVDSWTTWGLASKTKVRIGNLTGVTDADFGGALSGNGIYATGNAYFKGYIRGSEVRGGYIETADRTNTALSSVFLDGTNNYLEFRKAGRSLAADYSIRLSDNADGSGRPGFYFIDGYIGITGSTGNSLAMKGGYVSLLKKDNIASTSVALSVGAENAGGESTAIVGYATTASSYPNIGVYGTAANGLTNWAGYFANGNVGIENYLIVGNQASKTTAPFGIYFGSAKDVDLYRAGADLLKTDDIFDAPEYKVDGTTFIGDPLTANKILIANNSGVIASSTIASSELFTPAYGTMKETTYTDTLRTDGDYFNTYKHTTNGTLKGVFHDTANDYLYIATADAGVYEVNYTVSYTVDATDTYYWAVLNSGATILESRNYQYATTGQAITISGGGTTTLSDSSTIKIGCLATTGRTVTITYLKVFIKKISN